jgi:hypothetical protein
LKNGSLKPNESFKLLFVFILLLILIL